jgi:ABC-type Mn2+/Zn2+ transport system ATPase subunit
MFIARALAQEAEMMLMDEPLTGLDSSSQEDIFRILAKRCASSASPCWLHCTISN